MSGISVKNTPEMRLRAIYTICTVLAQGKGIAGAIGVHANALRTRFTEAELRVLEAKPFEVLATIAKGTD